MSVVVGEQTALKHFVGRGFNSWNHGSRIESTLLYLCKVILWVLIQHHFSNLYQRVVGMWPDLGQIKWIERAFFSLVKRHNLKVHCPRGIFPIGNCVVKLPVVVVCVRASQSLC